MSKNKTEAQIQDNIDTAIKAKKVKKLYRCSECTNSVTLTITADVVCTRCNVPMRLFEAEQSGLFITTTKSEDKDKK